MDKYEQVRVRSMRRRKREVRQIKRCMVYMLIGFLLGILFCVAVIGLCLVM